METREAHRVESGWEVIARDGSSVGTVSVAEDDEIEVRSPDAATAPVRVPAHLIVEAHDGRVFVDLGPDAFGRSSTGDEASSRGVATAVPDKGLKVEDVRRVTGG